VNPVHVSSGTRVFPWRWNICRLVLVGVSAVHVTAPQVLGPPASYTRDRKLPLEAYEMTWIQSTDSARPPTA
jgi:hypothetical protein